MCACQSAYNAVEIHITSGGHFERSSSQRIQTQAGNNVICDATYKRACGVDPYRQERGCDG